MANFNKFNVFVEALAEKTHNLQADTLKVYLSNQFPIASTHTTYNGTAGGTAPAEIAAVNGYVAGGNVATLVSSSQAAGVYRLILSDPAIWTATGGSIGPFRYFVLWNSTAATNDLIGWWDYGSSVTLNNTESFLVDLDQTTGVLTLT
jgi:hypothetical protein